jgi:hypothetical protein
VTIIKLVFFTGDAPSVFEAQGSLHARGGQGQAAVKMCAGAI